MADGTSSGRRLAAVALVLLVALAGCSGGSFLGSGDDGDGAHPSSGGDEGAGAPGGVGSDGERAKRDAGGSESSVSAVQAGRAIVRTGNVSLTVEGYGSARDRLTSLARARGGYVAASSRTTHRRANETWTTGRLVLRVPSDSFGETFEAVTATGEVEHAASDTTDVTDRLVDLEARLANLRAQRERLRGLYQRANDTEAVLSVGERLSGVQERIERLAAKKRQLEDRVAYSTVTVRLAEPEPDPVSETPTPSAPYHETGLVSAFASSVDGVAVAARTAAVTAAYAAPYLLAFGLPLAGLAAAGRSRGFW